MSKKSIDNIDVPDRVWYYLLDWNETNNWGTMFNMFEKRSLKECTMKQIIILFDVASRQEVKNIKLCNVKQ